MHTRTSVLHIDTFRNIHVWDGLMRLDSVLCFFSFLLSPRYLFRCPFLFVKVKKNTHREIAKRKKRNHKKMRTRIVFSREREKKWFTTRYGCSRRFYFFFVFNFVSFFVVLRAPFRSLARSYLIRDDKFFAIVAETRTLWDTNTTPRCVCIVWRMCVCVSCTRFYLH